MHDLKALIFDLQGTATDFRSSVAECAQHLGQAHAPDVDWGAFVDRWRGRYRPALDEVLAGARPWRSVDAIYREALDAELCASRLEFFTEPERQELNRAWQLIRPWPDALDGLQRLKARYLIAALSNADMRTVVSISKAGGLPWDAVFAAEIVETFKPDPRTYRMALRFLGVKPAEAMMVACHTYDLRAAQSLGLRAAFVARPLEFGPGGPADVAAAGEFDVHASDFIDLARQLGA